LGLFPRQPRVNNIAGKEKSMDGIVPSLGVSAVRINSDVISWPKVGNAQRRVLI
jgi:hypothetical protein